MQITLCLEQDAEAAGCSWDEVEKVVRHWASGHAASLPHLYPRPQTGIAVTLDLQTDDLLSAIRHLHDDLYDLQVNFTVSVD